MDEDKEVVASIIIDSIISNLYQSQMSDEECDAVLYGIIDTMMEMLDIEYKQDFQDIFKTVIQELEEIGQDDDEMDASVERIANELGWEWE